MNNPRELLKVNDLLKNSTPVPLPYDEEQYMRTLEELNKKNRQSKKKTARDILIENTPLF